MSKVVLTNEQAEAIEKIKKDVKGGITYGNIEAQLHKRWTLPTFKSLNTLNIKEFLDALYIGYEVEPEFKVGDWVVNVNGTIGKITNINEFGEYEGFWLNELYTPMLCQKGNFARHATPEEIKQEKERRWWAKHGREVKEYRKGDLFIHPHERRVYEIIEIDPKDSFSIRFIDRFGENDGFSYEAGLRIVCFAEQRLDKEDTQ